MSNRSDGSGLPPGFYQDAQGTMRWWDGSGWTEQTQQAAPPYGGTPDTPYAQGGPVTQNSPYGSSTSPYGYAAPAQETKTPWYKRKVVWGIAAAIVLIALVSGGGGGTDDSSDTVASDSSDSAGSSGSSQRDAGGKKAPQAAEPESEAPEPESEPVPEATTSEANALAAAENYLSFAPFSRAGLIQQLSSPAGDGYPVADATYAVDNVEVDWNEQAALAAKNYLDLTSFSRQGLIDQLTSPAGDQYTLEQATYGVNQTGL